MIASGTENAGNLFRITGTDRYWDYCLQPYEPVRKPQGKLRSKNLLWQSLRGNPTEDTMKSLASKLEAHCGQDFTVFGVKWDGKQLFWEYYFYEPLLRPFYAGRHHDAERTDDKATLGAISEAVASIVALAPPVRDPWPYFMFSFEVDTEQLAKKKVPELNLYLANETGHGGYSYRYRGDGGELANTYHFYSPLNGMDEILFRIKRSVFVDYEKVPLHKVLLPELFACNKICVAKKRFADGIYYSGLRLDQFMWFLDKFAYPQTIVDFVNQHETELDHLRYDVGIDYRMNSHAELVVQKTSFYGTL